ncbi:hypothetical protein BDR07DRAFT_1491481 [Suillus spraguei]|nr:hypothetical protein BDR07DRAFT_1491481 [Suillus spraguei]
MSAPASKEGQDGVKGGDGVAAIMCESESEKGLVALGTDQKWMAVVEWMAVVAAADENRSSGRLAQLKMLQAWKGGTPPQAGADGWGKEPMVTSILAGRGIGPPMWTDQGVEISSMINSRLGHKYFSAEGGIGEEERMKLVVPWEFS